MVNRKLTDGDIRRTLTPAQHQLFDSGTGWPSSINPPVLRFNPVAKLEEKGDRKYRARLE